MTVQREASVLRPEAAWLQDELSRYNLGRSSRVLNVGSSTAYFRTVEQPWIDECVFAPLRDRGVEIVHLDLKPAAGVDVVGDLTDPGFRAIALSGHWDVVLCSNLLEHVPERTGLCRALEEFAASINARLLVTCPHDFPYHPDPIDTMYRPDVDELAAAFPGLRLLNGAIVRAELHWSYWAHYMRLEGKHPRIETVRLARGSLRRKSTRTFFRDLWMKTSATCAAFG